MDDKEANSELGIKSRQLAFVILEVANVNWRDGKLERLQGALYDYGAAVVYGAVIPESKQVEKVVESYSDFKEKLNERE